VQLSHLDASISLDDLAEKLAGVGPLTRNEFLLRLKVADYEITIFPDARVVISGTDDITTARAVYAQYVGN
jgi:adenylyltransferase/sulfurtransferase